MCHFVTPTSGPNPIRFSQAIANGWLQICCVGPPTRTISDPRRPRRSLVPTDQDVINPNSVDQRRLSRVAVVNLRSMVNPVSTKLTKTWCESSLRLALLRRKHANAERLRGQLGKQFPSGRIELIVDEEHGPVK